MNQWPQFDLHPDAEALNAFVEEELAELERERILAHMADCGRCRQIVYLAQDAAVEVAQGARGASVAEVVAGRHMGWRHWFVDWRFAWAPAALLVGISLAVYLARKPQSPVEQIAKVIPGEQGTVGQPSMAASSSAGKGMAEDRARASMASRQAERKYKPPVASQPGDFEAGPVAAIPEAEPSLSGSHSSARKRQETVAMQAPAIAKEEPAKQAEASDYRMAGQATVSVVSIPETMISASVAPVPGASMNTIPARAAHGPSPHGGARAEASAYRASALNGAAAHSVMGFNRGLLAVNKSASVDALIARDAMQLKLPSGSTPISTAFARHRLLAVDSSGALFLSSDNGANWELVAPQWSGQARQVIVLMPQGDRPSGDAPAVVGGQASSTETQPIAVQENPKAFFEIVTDTGSFWMSMDGKSWKAKQGEEFK